MKVDVIALKGFGTYKKGARARMPKYHAATLESAGFVKVVPAEVVAPAPVVPKRGTYARRDITAESRTTAPDKDWVSAKPGFTTNYGKTE